MLFLMQEVVRQFEIVVPPSVVNFSMLCPRSSNTGGLYKVLYEKR